jgi:hypothetical protein
MTGLSELHWTENGEARSALWRMDAGAVMPKTVVLADDTLTADSAYRLACAGTGLLWRSDFQNARQLLQAMARRMGQPKKTRAKKASTDAAPVPGAAFHAHRLAQSQRNRVLSAILIELDGDYGLALRRAPDVRQACVQAFGPAQGQRSVISLRSLQGAVGAFEWRKNGVKVPAMGEALRIYPHYGVFSPVRVCGFGRPSPLARGAQSPIGRFRCGGGHGRVVGGAGPPGRGAGGGQRHICAGGGLCAGQLAALGLAKPGAGGAVEFVSTGAGGFGGVQPAVVARAARGFAGPGGV